MATRTDKYDLLFDEIQIEDGQNPRPKLKRVPELADEIVAAGKIINPIQAYMKKGDIGKYTVVVGHRRIAAVELAIKQGRLDRSTFKIPMIKLPSTITESEKDYLHLSSNSGEPLGILAEAITFQRRFNDNETVAEIAKKSSYSPTHISNCLLLMTSTLAVKKMIIDEKVSATLVIDLLKTKEPKVVEEELRAAAAGKVKDVIDEPAPAVKKEGKGADDSDIPGKEDNTKTSGKNTQTLPEEKASKPVKITKKDLAPKKPKEPTYNREQMKTVLESLLLECKEFQNKKIPIELDIENWMTINVDQ